jgi:hypothetical protein
MKRIALTLAGVALALGWWTQRADDVESTWVRQPAAASRASATVDGEALSCRVESEASIRWTVETDATCRDYAFLLPSDIGR